MKPSDFAKSYKCYQDCIEASDADLAKLLRLGCGGVAVSAFEDAMVTTLGRWLRYMTGVPFVKAYQAAPRPEEKELMSGQYGTIHLLSVTGTGAAPVRSVSRVVIDGEEQWDLCENISRVGKYSFQLDVYRDSGQNEAGETDSTVRYPVGSAFDVLQRAKSRMLHHVHRAALSQYGLVYDDHAMERVLNLPPEKVQETYESRASANIEIMACSSSQMRQPVIGENHFQEFDFECEADLSDLEKPAPAEIIC